MLVRRLVPGRNLVLDAHPLQVSPQAADQRDAGFTNKPRVYFQRLQESFNRLIDNGEQVFVRISGHRREDAVR
ncbi:hypothetical protein D3C76_1401220 [compost metagenome]